MFTKRDLIFGALIHQECFCDFKGPHNAQNVLFIVNSCFANSLLCAWSREVEATCQFSSQQLSLWSGKHVLVPYRGPAIDTLRVRLFLKDFLAQKILLGNFGWTSICMHLRWSISTQSHILSRAVHFTFSIESCISCCPFQIFWRILLPLFFLHFL